ncbi:MAG: hypothetical protein NTW16_14960, partial [Bacteroidetes bacterium]|nr:hypothetical protein [Bacteroidota bacterium]
MRTICFPVGACLILIFWVSCSSDGSGQAKGLQPLPKAGTIHKLITCAGDPGISYALYLPNEPHPSTPGADDTQFPLPPQAARGKNGKRVYPVIVALDPHGDGVLPISFYKDLADKYGFILIGSNDSKNGLPAEKVNAIVNGLMQEVRKVYPVDTNRIYLLGFSGGARIAAMTAMYQVPVKGVIACGAGFNSAKQPVLYKFDYFGIAGTADFNLSELVQMDEPLSRAGFRHYIKMFPGNHAWPPADVMEDGFCWVTLNAMKDGALEKSSSFISGVKSIFQNRTSASIRVSHLLSAADQYRETIAFIDGLAPIDMLKDKLAVLEKQPEYQAQLAYRLKVLKQEEEEKQELMQALQSKDLIWWKQRINRHASRVTRHEKVNPEDTLKERRLISFLSLFCYMNANAAMAQQEETAAIKIIAIYEMADPSNPE